MSSTATLSYTAYLGGLSAAKAAAALAAVPLPLDLLYALGLRVISDSTPTASPAVRTIVLGLNPVSAATATAVILGSQSGSPVKSVTVSAAGSGYTAPPIISFSGGRPTIIPAQSAADSVVPNVNTPQLDTIPFAYAFLKAVSAAVLTGGSGYSAETFILVGPPKPGVQLQAGTPGLFAGTQMVLTPTIGGGVITGVAISNAGAGYTSPPTIEVIDPGVSPGSGANISVSMGLSEIDVTYGGNGFNAAPTVAVTPRFQALFPSATAIQASPFINLLTTALSQALKSPVVASTPIIA